MIDKKLAAEQVGRLMGLDGFPTGSAAIKELVFAMQVAETDAIAIRFVDDWIGSETKAPYPVDIRRALYDANESRKRKAQRCRACAGSGAIIRWYLVTYQGQTLRKMKHCERLAVNSEEEAMEFARKIAENPVGEDYQTVLSGAARCSACSLQATRGSDGAP